MSRSPTENINTKVRLLKFLNKAINTSLSKQEKVIGEKLISNERYTGRIYLPQMLKIKLNLCGCKTCYPINSVHPELKLCQYTPDNEGFICVYCNQPFSPDESLEVQMNEYLKNKKDEERSL